MPSCIAKGHLLEGKRYTFEDTKGIQLRIQEIYLWDSKDIPLGFKRYTSWNEMLSFYLLRTFCAIDGGYYEDENTFFFKTFEVDHHLVVGYSHRDKFCHFLAAITYD